MDAEMSGALLVEEGGRAASLPPPHPSPALDRAREDMQKGAGPFADAYRLWDQDLVSECAKKAEKKAEDPEGY